MIASLAAFSASSSSSLLRVLVLADRLLEEENNFLRALIARIKSSANSFSTPSIGDDESVVVGMKVYAASVVAAATDADFPRGLFMVQGRGRW